MLKRLCIIKKLTVNTLMDTIISRNFFTSSTGALVTKAGASITQRNVTKIEIV